MFTDVKLLVDLLSFRFVNVDVPTRPRLFPAPPSLREASLKTANDAHINAATGELSSEAEMKLENLI